MTQSIRYLSALCFLDPGNKSIANCNRRSMGRRTRMHNQERKKKVDANKQRTNTAISIKKKISLTIVQAFTYPRNWCFKSQSNSQSILCRSLGFSILAVNSLAKGNFNCSYVCFFSILLVISQCCNTIGFLHFLYPE